MSSHRNSLSPECFVTLSGRQLDFDLGSATRARRGLDHAAESVNEVVSLREAHPHADAGSLGRKIHVEEVLWFLLRHPAAGIRKADDELASARSAGTVAHNSDRLVAIYEMASRSWTMLASAGHRDHPPHHHGKLRAGLGFADERCGHQRGER